MGKTTFTCPFPAWGGSPGEVELSPGPVPGWAVMDAETPHQHCIHELLGAFTQWNPVVSRTFPWGSSTRTTMVSPHSGGWHHGVTGLCPVPFGSGAASSHPRSSCISNTSKYPLWYQALGETELRADRLLGVK